MKHVKKAVIAGVVGAAILGGGLGSTFATWQNSATAPAGSVVTGNMSVQLGTISGWALHRVGGGHVTSAPLSQLRLTPGTFAIANLPITPVLEGQALTINDIKLSTTWGENLNLDDAGYLLDADGQRTHLRFSVITNSNTADWMFRNPELRITFERSTDLTEMYENALDIALGDVVVTITQR